MQESILYCKFPPSRRKEATLLERQTPAIPREQYLQLVGLAEDLCQNARQGCEGFSPEQLVAALVERAAEAMAEDQRRQRRSRQAEGIARAKREGVRFGRPMAQAKGDFPGLVAQWQAGQITFRQAQQASGLSESTFYRRLRQLRQA